MLVGRGFAKQRSRFKHRGDQLEMCQRRWAPPTLGVSFDFGHVLVLAWEEPREQAVQCQLMR